MKNKDRYDLTNIEWEIREDGIAIFYKAMLINTLNVGASCFPAGYHVAKWLEEEYLPLDKKEIEYLKAVIRPWKDRVKGIIKSGYRGGCQYLIIIYTGLNGLLDSFYMPDFKEGTMYQGMKLGKEYSLEELGL